MAERILRCAAIGERDPTRLRMAAMLEVGYEAVDPKDSPTASATGPHIDSK